MVSLHCRMLSKRKSLNVKLLELALFYCSFHGFRRYSARWTKWFFIWNCSGKIRILIVFMFSPKGNYLHMSKMKTCSATASLADAVSSLLSTVSQMFACLLRCRACKADQSLHSTEGSLQMAWSKNCGRLQISSTPGHWSWRCLLSVSHWRLQDFPHCYPPHRITQWLNGTYYLFIDCRPWKPHPTLL